MKKIIDIINNPTVSSSIFGAVIGSLVTAFFNNRGRKKDSKEKYKDRKYEEYKNKPELRVVKGNNESKPDISIINVPIYAKYINKECKIVYPKEEVEKREYLYKDIVIKNIGENSINQLDICVANQKHNILSKLEEIDYLAENELLNYNYCYDFKIMPNEVLKIRLYYLKSYNENSNYNCDLCFLFIDSFGNMYEQPFFFEKENLYEPTVITAKDYRNNVTTDVAEECFKNPCNW